MRWAELQSEGPSVSLSKVSMRLLLQSPVSTEHHECAFHLLEKAPSLRYSDQFIAVVGLQVSATAFSTAQTHVPRFYQASDPRAPAGACPAQRRRFFL